MATTSPLPTAARWHGLLALRSTGWMLVMTALAAVASRLAVAAALRLAGAATGAWAGLLTDALLWLVVFSLAVHTSARSYRSIALTALLVSLFQILGDALGMLMGHELWGLRFALFSQTTVATLAMRLATQAALFLGSVAGLRWLARHPAWRSRRTLALSFSALVLSFLGGYGSLLIIGLTAALPALRPTFSGQIILGLAHAALSAVVAYLAVWLSYDAWRAALNQPAGGHPWA